MKRGFWIGLLTGWIQLTRHKFVEWNLDFGKLMAPYPFDIGLKWNTREDHAGIRFHFSIYHLFLYEIAIYDHRHWDYDNEDWCGDGKGVCAVLSEYED